MSVELPTDAEGREIPLDTTVLYDKDGNEIEVSRYQYYPKVGPGYWNLRSVRNKYYRTDEVYLTPSDSWEKLLEDLGEAGDARYYEACAYFHRDKDEGGCISCPGGEDGCARIAMRDIADRIRKLRGENDG